MGRYSPKLVFIGGPGVVQEIQLVVECLVHNRWRVRRKYELKALTNGFLSEERQESGLQFWVQVLLGLINNEDPVWTRYLRRSDVRGRYRFEVRGNLRFNKR